MNTLNESGTAKLNRAEMDVSKSLSNFESALDELANAVDEASHVVQGFIGLVRLPKEELEVIFNKAKDVFGDVRKNPQPYALAATAALCLLGLRQWRKNRAHRRQFTVDASY